MVSPIFPEETGISSLMTFYSTGARRWIKAKKRLLLPVRTHLRGKLVGKRQPLASTSAAVCMCVRMTHFPRLRSGNGRVRGTFPRPRRVRLRVNDVSHGLLLHRSRLVYWEP